MIQITHLGKSLQCECCLNLKGYSLINKSGTSINYLYLGFNFYLVTHQSLVLLVSYVQIALLPFLPYFLYFFFIFCHTQRCSGTTPGSELRNHFWWAQVAIRVLGLDPRSVACKANVLYAVLSILSEVIFYYFTN